jgi:hypothetical protein
VNEATAKRVFKTANMGRTAESKKEEEGKVGKKRKKKR